MSYVNTFNENKSYEEVRFQFGQKPVSQEFNEMQSIQHDKIVRMTDVLFEPGFIYDGCELLSFDENTLSISAGHIHLDGFARSFETQSINIGNISGDVVDIYAVLMYTEFTKENDLDLVHPLQPDLPVAHRAKSITFLTTQDPDTLSTPTNFLRQFAVKVLQYNKTTGVLEKLVTNLTKFIQLGLIPGQITINQIQPGSISVEQIDLNVDGMSIRDALALRTDDANGNFLASGGAVVFVDNDINTGVKVRLEAFRAYIKGYLIKVEADNELTLRHTNTTKARNNEPKNFSEGTLVYSLSKRPANELVALDGDVTVNDLTLTRDLTSNYDAIPSIYTPVTEILDIRQVGKTFVKNVDYILEDDNILWLTNNRPAGGSSFQIDFTYRRAFEIGTDVILGADRKSLEFTGTVLPNNTSNFQVSYTFFLPRIDILACDQNGNIRLFEGVPAENPKPPIIPEGLFQLAHFNLPAGTHLGNTFLTTNGYTAPGASSINFRRVQVIASKMKDHQQRAQNLIDLAFNDAVNTALNYFISKDPSLTKKGTFADAFFDDRLSDYGQPDQTMVFNSELQQGEAARKRFIQLLKRTTGAVPNVKFHQDSFASLNYTEVALIEQQKWTGEVNVNPFVEAFEIQKIHTPNQNVVYGQEVEVHGFHWNFGEENIRFFINNKLVTDINVEVGSPGAIDHSVTPDENGNFVVTFNLPSDVPIGYRLLKAESQITGNHAEMLLGVQTAAAPAPAIANLPPEVVTPDTCGPCGKVRRIPNHGKAKWRPYLIRKHRSRGEIQRFDCNTCKWKFIGWYDPLAQTFVPDEDCFITSVDVFFTSKDPNFDVTGALILTKDGEPDLNSGMLGVANIKAVDVKTDGQATKFKFEKPVFVQGGRTYAFYLETACTGYRVQFAKLGGIDRSQYEVTPAGYSKVTSKTSSPIGPLSGVADNQKRDRNTTHRWTQKSMSFTVSQPSNLYEIDTEVYIGPDAGSKSAMVSWTLTNTTTNTLLWSHYSIMSLTGKQRDGKFCVNGFRGDYPDVPKGNDVIPAPIGLVPGHNYQLRISVDQGYLGNDGYKFIRDNYPADGILNGHVTIFTQATKVFNKITQNALTTGLLWRSPDGETWQGAPDEDLRIIINKANFQDHTSATINFKPFNTEGGVNNETLLDSITHFTSLINSVTPNGTSVLMEYSLDNGATWTPHIPVVFKQLESNNDEDRNTWAFFNFGFFSDVRFREQQIDPQFVPSNPNKEVSLGFQTGNLPATQIRFRMHLSTTNNNLSPVVDTTNWSVVFEKYEFQTRYFSRTTALPQNADSVKVYVWAKIPSGAGIVQQVSITLDGLNTINPVYVSKTIPSETRVIDAANDIVEYTYEFDASDLSTQVVFNRPKVRITYTTNDRFVQPIVKRVSYNAF